MKNYYIKMLNLKINWKPLFINGKTIKKMKISLSMPLNKKKQNLIIYVKK